MTIPSLQQEDVMTELRIRDISVCSHKLDDKEPPNYGTLSVDVGGVNVRLMLTQDQVDVLVAAAEPVAKDIVREIASMKIAEA